MSLDLALLSLQGLSVGDAFGEQFFSHPGWIRKRELPPGRWRWTDDTHMALSIVETLKQHGRVEQDALATAFARRYREDPRRGYGAGAARLLRQINQGQDWRKASPALFPGGSFGNGAAMRVAPVGAFFSSDPARAASEAVLSAEITHAHPEGKAGAAAVAVAAAAAARNALLPGGERLAGPAFLTHVLEFLPPTQTRAGLQAALDIPPEAFDRAVLRLGTGGLISAQDTVPFCLWCAAYHLDSYEAALWQTAAGFGDVDTTCAIVGGIVALSSASIPQTWLERREPLPHGFQK